MVTAVADVARDAAVAIHTFTLTFAAAQAARVDVAADADATRMAIRTFMLKIADAKGDATTLAVAAKGDATRLTALGAGPLSANGLAMSDAQSPCSQNRHRLLAVAGPTGECVQACVRGCLRACVRACKRADSALR